MKKVLAIILTLSLLLTVIPAAFAEEYEVSKVVLGTEIPTGYTRHTTIKVNQGFYGIIATSSSRDAPSRTCTITISMPSALRV